MRRNGCCCASLLGCAYPCGYYHYSELILNSVHVHRQSRMPPILPPSLTLSRFPIPPSNTPNASPPVTADRQTAPTLTHVLASLLPTLLPLPLSLPTLNTTPFIPESKDEDLHSGWLQLPSGSICLVTEGGVREGGVWDRGQCFSFIFLYI